MALRSFILAVASTTLPLINAVHIRSEHQHVSHDHSLHRRAPAPVTSGLPTPWKYAACYIDGVSGRVFENSQPGSDTLTIQSCINTCRGLNYTLAGAEFGRECFCGNRMINGAAKAPETDCGMPCAGDATQACGAGGRLSVYSATANVTVLPTPTTQTTGLPGLFTYAGCYNDIANPRVFPWQIIFDQNNTIPNCLNQCSTFGYSAAATQFGRECYCGDATDLAKTTRSVETECKDICSGDPIHFCGGGLKLSTYTWNGTKNVFNNPANKGRYEFLVPGVVTPLISTLGINDKVTFLEKSGTGIANATGAYELDLTLTGSFRTAYREMHVKTDVFCAASIILPDKAGRQLNVGGWSGDSLSGVRLYTPSGSAGVNGTTDWEEDFKVLALQRPRWYPTAAIMPNGSVLVIGGQIGSNDRPQPNLEILPKPAGGSTVLEMDWLLRTDPNNLYPHVVVLPSGRLFIAYWNEARILNQVTFATIKELPNMPGSVNNFLGGRTYPLQGAMVPLPMTAPYTALMKVLVCGGSSAPPSTVIDNCVSIEPEATNPVWVIERMPNKRVMPNMVPLPDGTVMIINGAKEGIAGFGLASEPNLGALIYKPTNAVSQRMIILGNTILPRLYHSEAILMPDARVLVSGNDPETPAYPAEFRLEAYVPPYLTEGRTQPTFTITNKNWAYGASITFTVRLFHGATSALRVSLIGAMSSTHGNTMGARTLFPAVSCVLNSCTVTAPPNANISPPGWHQMFILDGATPSRSQWVRIGGDPGSVGNWPNLPGFTRPGL